MSDRQEVPPYVIALDIGTSNTRAILYDGGARVVMDCSAQRPNRFITTADGGAVFEADDLLAGVVEVIDEVLERAGARATNGQIGAVAMDTLVGNVLGVDGDGRPISPVYTYADTRNAADAQALRRELGKAGMAAAHDRTGCLIHTSYLPARFRWLARTEPALMQQAARWVSIGEYVLFRLLGEWKASYSVASWSGLLNRRDLTWDDGWLELLPVTSDRLSPLGDLDRPLSGLCSEWAQRWPALAQVPWLPAIGDGAAANVGSGCDAPERVALTVGSTAAMRVVVDPDLARVPSGLWLYRVDARRGLLGGATTEGGNLFGWLRETLALPQPERLERMLAEMPADGHGLTVLPFIAGERAPGWREDARAVVHGLSLHTRSEDIVQASLEAIAYRFAIIYGRIAPNLPQGERRIVASGGGLLSSPAWMQIFADVLGEPLLTLDEKEATSRGAALLALEQLGAIAALSDLPPVTGRTFEPDAVRHAVYVEALARQVALYEKLLD